MRVLIVDDSRIFREIVASCLRAIPGVQIVDSVWSGRKALEVLEREAVDLVTLDVNMPEMDGLQTLAAIQERNARGPVGAWVGVVMLSALTHEGAETTLRALEMGAFDFLGKPAAQSETAARVDLTRDLAARIEAYRAHRTARDQGLGATRGPAVVTASPGCDGTPGPSTTPPPPHPPTPSASMASTPHAALATPKLPKALDPARVAVAIGCSTGGPKALTEIMPAIRATVPGPILVVQHMPANFTASLANNLARVCGAPAREARAGERLAEGVIYVAPGGRHLLVREEAGGAICALNDQPPERGCRPSVDVLFRSLAKVYARRVVAVVLTGMGDDGARSLASLARAGARIIAQDEASSVVWGMPRAAVETGLVHEIVPLRAIPEAIARNLPQC